MIKPFRNSFRLVTTLVLLVGCAASPAPKTPVSNPDPLANVSPKQLFQMGIELARRGDYIRAENYLAAAIDAGAPEKYVLPHLVDVCVASSKLHSAIQHLSPYLARNPNEWRLRLISASIQLAVGDVEGARIQAKQVVSDSSRPVPDAHYVLAMVYKEDQHSGHLATEHFQQYLALEPKGKYAEQAKFWIRNVESEEVERGTAHQVKKQ